MNMPTNITWPERIVRFVIGLGILGLFGALPAPWRYLTLLGLIPLGTSLTGYCPVYAAIGWNRQIEPQGGKRGAS
jgi:Inner membrane protein YgaP-like, transmembrane domain